MPANNKEQKRNSEGMGSANIDFGKSRERTAQLKTLSEVGKTLFVLYHRQRLNKLQPDSGAVRLLQHMRQEGRPLSEIANAYLALSQAERGRTTKDFSYLVYHDEHVTRLLSAATVRNVLRSLQDGIQKGQIDPDKRTGLFESVFFVFPDGSKAEVSGIEKQDGEIVLGHVRVLFSADEAIAAIAPVLEKYFDNFLQ